MADDDKEEIFNIDGSLKYGNRNNAEDRGRIRKVRALANEMVSVTKELEPDDEDRPEGEMPIMKTADVEDTFIAFGSEIKSLGETPEGLHVGGYLVKFGSPQMPDITMDYFTKDTDFDLEPGQERDVSVYLNHRQPLKASTGDAIAIRSKIGKGKVQLDDVGILIDAIVYNNDKYQEIVAKHMQKMGWSSGTAVHLMDKEKQPNGTYWIKKWPIGVDASLTPTPAEPRNIVTLKSLVVTQEDGSTLMDAPAGEPAVQDSKDADSATKTTKITGENIMEITEEKLTELINGAVKSGVDEALKSLPAVKSEVKVTTDAADQPFASDGEFFLAVKAAAYHPSLEDPRLRAIKATGMSEGVPADGGYLLQSQRMDKMLERMYTSGEILSRIAKDPVGPNANGVTYNGIDETTRVTGSRWGGLRGYWLAEAGTLTASKPKFRQIELKLKKVAALAYATDEQLQDTVNLESWLSRTVPDELRFLTEDAIFEGDGVGKPLGILNAPCLISVLRDTASTVVFADIVNMWARRWAGVKDYAWFVNQDVTPKLDQLVLASSTEMPTRFIEYGPDGVLRMKGRPVIEVEYAATLGDVGDIVLASMSQYQAIDKGGIQTASSIHVQFLTDETAFRFIYRIDGEPTWHSALTPFHGSNTVSPFVALSSASV